MEHGVPCSLAEMPGCGWQTAGAAIASAAVSGPVVCSSRQPINTWPSLPAQRARRRRHAAAGRSPAQWEPRQETYHRRADHLLLTSLSYVLCMPYRASTPTLLYRKSLKMQNGQ